MCSMADWKRRYSKMTFQSNWLLYLVQLRQKIQVTLLSLCVGMLEKKRILLWKSNLFETSLHLAYSITIINIICPTVGANCEEETLLYLWQSRLMVKIVCRELSWSRFVLRNMLPRKELEPEIIISPRAHEGRGRTISTRAVALLQHFSCACLGDWSYFISSIFIYRACLNCILYLSILQQICTYFITELPSLCLWIIPGICCRHF